MAHSYAVTDIVRSPRGAVRANLTERGIVVARISRPAPAEWVMPYTLRFLSSQAEARFQTFSDCLSMSECVEAIGL